MSHSAGHVVIFGGIEHDDRRENCIRIARATFSDPALAAIFKKDIAMSIHPRMDEFGSVPASRSAGQGFWQHLAAYFKLVFSGAKGDQGGWESGARGM